MDNSKAEAASRTAITVVHKFIRQELFSAAATLARAEPGEVESVQHTLEQVGALLQGHAAHEDAAFAPLLRLANAAYGERMHADHTRLEAQFEAVQVSAKTLEPEPAKACRTALLQLHLDFNRFVGNYLLHLDDEERAWFPLLREQMAPIETVAESVRSLEPDARRAFLEKLNQALAPSEYAKIVHHLAEGGS